MTNVPYVSMIKINGTPILPPLIEDSERPTLRRYREEAVLVEKKLADRARKPRGNEHLEPHMQDMSEVSSLSNLDTVQVMHFIRQALKDSSHLDEVRHLQEVIHEELQKYEGGASLAKCDSMDTLHNIDDLTNTLGLSSLDASLSNHKSSSSQECESMVVSKNANTLIKPETNCLIEINSPSLAADSLVEPRLSLNYPPVPFANNSSTLHTNDPGIASEQSVKNESPPKLIRRNSYTLESPSPSVLLYLKSLNIDDNTTFSSNSSLKNARRNLNQVWSDAMSPSMHSTPGNHSNVSWLSETEPSECDVPERSRNIHNSYNSFSSENDHPDNMDNININHLHKRKSSNAISRDEAATKIQAGIRGYLTRRILKTNRIIDLKNAIRDSLIAALQIHTDTSTNKAELEFHRALTIQIESLCNEWHQIFFDYTPHERMRIIQVDRNKSKNPKNEQLLLKSKNGVGTSVSKAGNTSLAVRPKSLSLHPHTHVGSNIKK